MILALELKKITKDAYQKISGSKELTTTPAPSGAILPMGRVVLAMVCQVFPMMLTPDGQIGR